MKYLQRLFSVLLVCATFVGVFSTTAHAETLTPDLKITVTGVITGTNVSGSQSSSYTFYTDNDETTQKTFYNVAPAGGWYQINYNYVIESKDGSALIKADKEAKVKFDKFHSTYAVADNVDVALSNVWYISTYYKSNLLFTYADGSQEYYNNYVINSQSTHLKDLTFTVTPPKDIVRIDFFIAQTEADVNVNIDAVQFYGKHFGATFNLIVEQESKTEGLLGGIQQWIKNLYVKVTSGFDNLVKGITELPQKIWSFIEEGLKNLFVPDEQFMSGYSDSWDILLSERFGAIYDVASIIIDFVEQIELTDTTDTIYLPSVSLNSVGIPFSFGGYNVQVVPTGFGTIVEICKKIISIACTFLFINSLRKRYDEVMGVEQ